MAALTGEVLSRMPRPVPKREFALTPAAIVWGLVALGLAALSPTVASVVHIWSTVGDYEHGWVIAAISAIWLFRARARINASPVRPQPLALLALGLVMAWWMVAYRANSEALQQIVGPLALLLAVLAALGPAVLRQVFLPLGFLYFAIPVWDHLVPVLQAVTVWVTEALLGLLNVPADVEGHHVTIPAGQFSIVEGCSGKRYFTIGLAFGVLAAAAQGLRGVRFVRLLCIAGLAALVTNWLRVVIVIYAGHVTDMQHYFVAVEHITLGYALFAPLLLLIAVAARRLATKQQAPDDPQGAQGASPARKLLAGAAGSLALLASPLLVFATSPSTDESKASLKPLPVIAEKWQGPLPANGEWRPEYVAALSEHRAAYALAEGRIELYMNSYGVQTPGRELVFHRNSATPRNRWALVRRASARSDALPAVVVSNENDERWVVAQTYVVAGRLIATPAVAQLYYGLRAVWRPAPAGLIALAAPCETDCDAALRLLEDFWADNAGRFAPLIPEAM